MNYDSVSGNHLVSLGNEYLAPVKLSFMFSYHFSSNCLVYEAWLHNVKDHGGYDVNQSFGLKTAINHIFLLTLAPIWLPHCPAWIWTISLMLSASCVLVVLLSCCPSASVAALWVLCLQLPSVEANSVTWSGPVVHQRDPPHQPWVTRPTSPAMLLLHQTSLQDLQLSRDLAQHSRVTAAAIFLPTILEQTLQIF